MLGQLGRAIDQARRFYLQFMMEGLGIGHEAKFYETVDQRLLGDEQFIEAVDRKTERKLEIEKRAWQGPFSELVNALAEVHGVEPHVLLRGSRKRTWFSARAMLVYLGRAWSGMKTKELAKRLHHDTSVIIRLYRRYAKSRDLKIEEWLANILKRKVNMHA